MQLPSQFKTSSCRASDCVPLYVTCLNRKRFHALCKPFCYLSSVFNSNAKPVFSQHYQWQCSGIKLLVGSKKKKKKLLSYHSTQKNLCHKYLSTMYNRISHIKSGYFSYCFGWTIKSLWSKMWSTMWFHQRSCQSSHQDRTHEKSIQHETRFVGRLNTNEAKDRGWSTESFVFFS